MELDELLDHIEIVIKNETKTYVKVSLDNGVIKGEPAEPLNAFQFRKIGHYLDSAQQKIDLGEVS